MIRVLPHKEPYKCKYAFHQLSHVNEMAIVSLSRKIQYFKPADKMF